MVDPRGVVTSVRSPFGDSFEVDEGNFWFRFGQDGDEIGGEVEVGIKAHRMVEISRVQESDEEDEGSTGSGSGRHTPWQRPGTGGLEKDMV